MKLSCLPRKGNSILRQASFTCALATWRAKVSTTMSGPELFDEETGPSGDDDVYGIDASMDSGSESGSDLESPPRPTATSLTVRNFFSKSKKRQRRTSTGRNELEQHVSRGDRSSGIDRVENSQSKRRRGQLRKDVHAPSVTPNRPASGHSKATPETSKPSQSKGINENFNPRPAVELNTSASQDDDTSVKSALKEITSLLNTVVERVDRVETELKKQSSASSSSDSTPRTKKIIAVPLIVRVGYIVHAWYVLCLSRSVGDNKLFWGRTCLHL